VITGHVYFQPPATVQMSYPCIVYGRDGSHAEYADNQPYQHTKRYQVTVIDRNPDSELPDLVEGMRLCEFSRAYVADGLNHWVFTLFF
jgi:hypothetical protein